MYTIIGPIIKSYTSIWVSFLCPLRRHMSNMTSRTVPLPWQPGQNLRNGSERDTTAVGVGYLHDMYRYLNYNGLSQQSTVCGASGVCSRSHGPWVWLERLSRHPRSWPCHKVRHVLA